MHPGCNEQVAMLRYQELVARGLHEQFVASLLPPPASIYSVTAAIRQHLGTFLGRIRVRLPDVRAGASHGLGPDAVGERDTLVSSHEPMLWLSPYRLP